MENSLLNKSKFKVDIFSCAFNYILFGGGGVGGGGGGFKKNVQD